MQKIYFDELGIINLINNKDENAIIAFEKVYQRFKDESEKENAPHFALIQSIYISRDFNYVWQLTQKYHLSESTVLRYRKDILSWFYFYYDKIKSEKSV